MNSLDLKEVYTPWGFWVTLYYDHQTWTKILTILPGESTSLHRHKYRAEYWTPLDKGLSASIGGHRFLDLDLGKRYDVMRESWHRIENRSTHPASLIEVAIGTPSEHDVERKEDKYGRE